MVVDPRAAVDPTVVVEARKLRLVRCGCISQFSVDGIIVSYWDLKTLAFRRSLQLNLVRKRTSIPDKAGIIAAQRRQQLFLTKPIFCLGHSLSSFQG